MKKKDIVTCAIVLVLALVQFGAVNLLAGDRATLRVALDHDARTMNIAELKDGSNLVILMQMLEGLTSLNPDTLEADPKLAESFKIIEGKDIWVKLRKEPRFHTGDPVTAHDVKFTFQQFMDPKNAFAGRFLLSSVKEVEVLDDYTLIYRFKTPYAPWRAITELGIISQKYYEKVGRERFRKHPVGSGPFRYVEWKVAESVTMEAVEDHWAHKVDFKTLKLLIVPDENTRMAMLETGEVDLVGKIPPHQVKRLKKNPKIRIKRNLFDPNMIFTRINCISFPLLKDKNLILAINHAIDRERIVKNIYLGEGTPIYGSYAKGEIGYNTSFKFEYDPDKAREYLKKSSYKSEELLLSYGSKVINGLQLTAAIQKYLKDVGVNLKIRLLEEGTLATLRAQKSKELGHFAFQTWESPDPDLKKRLITHSKGPFTMYTDRPNQALVDQLVVGQLITVDPEKRLQILHKLEQELKGTEINLLTLNGIYAMNKRIDYTMLPANSMLTNLWTIRLMN